jgi:ribosome-binding factor A
MARRRFEDPDRGQSIRPDRIGSLIARILQERIVRGFADPRIRGLISVTGVEVAPDLRNALVRVSVLPASDGPRTIGGLRSMSGFLRRIVRDETSMRRVPDLDFRLDESLKHDAALDEAIRDGFDPGSSSSDLEGDSDIPADSDQSEGPIPEGDRTHQP